MIKSFVKRITRFGLNESIDILGYQRVLLTNALALVVISFCFLLAFVCLYFELNIHLAISLISMILMLPVFWFNHHNRHSLASFYLIHYCGIGVLAGSYFAFEANRITESENWLYAFLAISVFLFDGKRMFLNFLWFYLLICISKILKYQKFDWMFDENFILVMINVFILSTALFVFLVIFKSGFQRALLHLDTANKSKNKLFSIVAHDIRSPLTLFEGLLNIGETGGLSSEQFEHHQKLLKERFKPLQETINGILLWSQANLNSIVPNPSSFAVKTNFELILKALKPLCEAKSITTNFICDESKVYMDENHFQVIIRNLYHNAIKFSSSGGTVAIDCRQGNQWVEIQISDQGIGMNKNDIRSVLEGNALRSTMGTKGEKGTGIGLALCLELLRSNGGQMEIKVQEKGGTLFIILLPIG